MWLKPSPIEPNSSPQCGQSLLRSIDPEPQPGQEEIGQGIMEDIPDVFDIQCKACHCRWRGRSHSAGWWVCFAGQGRYAEYCDTCVEMWEYAESSGMNCYRHVKMLWIMGHAGTHFEQVPLTQPISPVPRQAARHWLSHRHWARPNDELELLSWLPARASVALIMMQGSLCPITLAHVRCFVEARSIILNDEFKKAARPARLRKFNECLGLVRLNGDDHVRKKLQGLGAAGQVVDIRGRGHLVDIATSEHKWLSYDARHDGCWALRARWPHLRFVTFVMNGADDVVAKRKLEWHDFHRRPMIVIRRPGYSEAVARGMEENGLDPNDGHCILGPELADISSTAARDAAVRGDRQELLTLVHPAVAERLLDREQAAAEQAAAEQAAAEQAAAGGTERARGTKRSAADLE